MRMSSNTHRGSLLKLRLMRTLCWLVRKRTSSNRPLSRAELWFVAFETDGDAGVVAGVKQSFVEKLVVAALARHRVIVARACANAERGHVDRPLRRVNDAVVPAPPALFFF
jgi:hypothetical protein